MKTMAEVVNNTKSSSNLWFWIFAIGVLIVILRPYLMGGLDGWGTDLEAARQAAADTNKTHTPLFRCPWLRPLPDDEAAGSVAG